MYMFSLEVLFVLFLFLGECLTIQVAFCLRLVLIPFFELLEFLLLHFILLMQYQ